MDKCNLDFLAKNVNLFTDKELNNLQSYCDVFDTSLNEICFLILKELSLPVPTWESCYIDRVIQSLLKMGW